MVKVKEFSANVGISIVYKKYTDIIQIYKDLKTGEDDHTQFYDHIIDKLNEHRDRISDDVHAASFVLDPRYGTNKTKEGNHRLRDFARAHARAIAKKRQIF